MSAARAAFRRVRLLAVSLVLGAAAACASSRPPPPRAPALATAADAVPPDLDLVVRVDLAKVRSALGPAGIMLLRKGSGGALSSDPHSELVAKAMEHSDTAYLALRPELIPGEADNVLVLNGHFGELGLDRELAQNGWTNPVDLGGAVRRFERPGKLSRGSAARVYLFGENELVFVSAAEIDSVEAVLERGARPNPLRPRATGVLAFAARLRVMKRGLSASYPLLARALGRAAGVEGSVDASDTGLSVELSLELPSEAEASDSVKALDGVREALAASEGKLAPMARDAKLEAVGRYAVVHVGLARGIL